ncbi:1,4-alpha-glucan branching protein GlgB [Roseateles sp. BYS180W]|uniref:1,4-alpha-glucan branching enzyme GlgB n=1 Tax=Roseateles rivi TaxID=3299028 RepID=A0ABW7FS82_9BURK
MSAELIAAEDLALLARGQHPRPWLHLGAHVQAGQGVRFAVWAPAARRVSVVGDFNAWDGRRHVLQRLGDSGIWCGLVAQAQLGQFYKYELEGPEGQLLPLKADPYARAAQLRPDNASVVSAAPPQPRALSAQRQGANRRDAPMSIYEVHAPSWRRPDGRCPNWDELAAQLPAYAADLGFTHVELLPITEYPFDGSWGYQALGPYAPSARFGPPEGFARFVAACHAQGLGVLLDWVPAHFPADAHGLARFDGTPLYEYADPREGYHPDWNTLIPDFAKPGVRQFLAGSALYWAECWGVDGLRVDAVASMLYRDYSRQPGQWLPNAQGGRENLEAIALLQHLNTVLGAQAPGVVTLAEESTAFAGVSAPVHAGGLGFHYKWNMGWMNDTLAYFREDPIHRRWHHDKLTFGLVYAFSENFVLPLSHDEVVHGKGSLLAKMPGDAWQQFANLRAYLGLMWGHPGKKLLFMGQEFGQPTEWNFEAELPWLLLEQPRHAGLQRLVRDLNQLYRREPALHRLDCEAAGFAWLQAEDREQSVLAWARFDGQGGVMVVVCNLTPVPRPGYGLRMPCVAPAWRVHINTDAADYGGSDAGTPIGALQVAADAQLSLDLPPLATLFLSPSP